MIFTLLELFQRAGIMEWTILSQETNLISDMKFEGLKNRALKLLIIAVAFSCALVFGQSRSDSVELEFSSHYTYDNERRFPNEYFPLAVGNYWIYKRPVPDGYVLLEMRVTGTYRRDGRNCYTVKTTDRRFLNGAQAGTLFFEGENCYCEVAGSIFDVCADCDGRRENEPFSPTFVKINDITTAQLRLPKILKLDTTWMDLPYSEDRTDYQVLGFENVCLHELAKSFDNCVKVKKTVSYEPRMNGFEWFCPGVGLVKDETEKLIVGHEYEAAYGYLIEYRVYNRARR